MPWWGILICVIVGIVALYWGVIITAALVIGASARKRAAELNANFVDLSRRNAAPLDETYHDLARRWEEKYGHPHEL